MHHETKYLIYVLIIFGISSIIVQAFLVPFIEIAGWRPDFVLIIVLLISKRFGTVSGSTSGFILGILQDSLTALPVGITAFPKVIVGYALGKFKVMRLEGAMYYLWFIIMIFLHECIFYAFLQFKIDVAFTQLLYSRVFPNTIYSSIMLFLVSIFTQKFFRE
jgi:rod shape-determining protein MreD